MISAC
ncbi:hypothetical protein D039_3867A, partial [Vibrio parahaemolyticus EKP-028]